MGYADQRQLTMLFFGDASEILTPGPVQLILLLALAWWWLREHRFARDLTAMLFVWTWIFSAPAIANLALAQLEGVPGQPASPQTARPFYLVMGAGTPPQANHEGRAELTLAGWRRTQAAIRHWRQTGGKLVFVGGFGTGPDPDQNSIAAAMAALASQWGVPASAIVTAGHQTSNSREDLLAAQPLVAAYPHPAYLITSAAHMPRAMSAARSLGMTLSALPCDYQQLQQPGWRAWFPNNGGPQLWQQSLHELLGTVVYQWRGWL
ncbi:MAG: YdcF family protein [Burkholderiaceae bacterium]